MMDAMTIKKHAQTSQTINVFLYHAVVTSRPAGLPRREWKYWMASNNFCSHMRLLAESPRRVASLAECWRASTLASQGRFLFQDPPAPQPAVLTFDDGRESDFTLVWPLLFSSGLPATFFVNTSSLGQPGHLRWSQVRRMSEEGASFQSHAHRHVDLTRLAPQALQTELKMSKDLLEGWVKRPVDFLAAPYGCVNPRVVDAALQAGYRAVCTSDPRPAFPGAERVSRIAIHADTTTGELARLTEGRRIPYWSRRARAALLAPVKAFLRPPLPKRKFLPEPAP